MGAWAIAGIVAASLVLLVAALGCIPGKLLVTYDAQDGLRLRGSVLWLKFGEKKPGQKAEPKKPPKKEREKAPPKAAEKHAKLRLETLTAHAGELAELLGKLLRRLGKLARSVVVKELRLLCVVGGDDPADTADQYGKICALLYPALGALHETLRVCEKNEQVDIRCAFNGESALTFRMLLQLRAAHVVRALLPLTPPALRLLRKLRPDGEAASRKRLPKAQSRPQSD